MILSVRSHSRPWLSSLALALSLLLLVGCSIWLIVVAPIDDPYHPPFLYAWLISFLPYIAACVLIWKIRPGSGRWHETEWGLIIMGAVLLRALFLPIPPNLSHDSWRYLWDARVTLHGYSPYVYAPQDPLFNNMRDILYQNSRFRNVPTIYPPAAQAVYLIGGLIAPTNLSVLKGIFMLFDLLTCGLLALLLRRKGFDPRLVIFYAWCPLPIVEFAMQGHVDVIAITFIIVAFFWNMREGKRARVLTGVFVALATMTKFYPLILLVVFMRRRDWLMPLACFATIVLSYIPFLILGHGQVLGFLSRYVGELGGNAGPIQVLLDKEIVQFFGANPQQLQIAVRLELVLDAIIVGGVSLVVWRLWKRGRINMEAVILLLIGIVLACSPHVFPWYTTVLLPWIIPAVGPGREAGEEMISALSPSPDPFGQAQGQIVVGQAGQAQGPLPFSSPPLAPTVWYRADWGIMARVVAFMALWYFPCISVISYFWAGSGNWDNYYVIAYEVMVGGLGLAALLGWCAVYFPVKISGYVREKRVKVASCECEQDEQCSEVSQSYLDEPVK
ncbi:MAG TPA: glycosyltransferase family 87 protein [Ktedonobacteraceae bacterium]|nr:glycosyltransferase family 87 protein [Ktedonobacteraceae bacterium]